VELRSIDYSRGLNLILSGIDLLDQTPVLDIKPYLPYADAVTEARTGIDLCRPTDAKKLHFAPQVKRFLAGLEPRFAGHLRRLIGQILENDPQPAYLQHNPARQSFGMRLYEYNVRWRVSADVLEVTSITPTDQVDDRTEHN
jgi:hypothetical protein